VRFEERQVRDIKVTTPYQAFERVRELSEANERLYKTFISPFVQSFANPSTAALLEWLHPMRTSRYLFSEAFNPGMRGVAALARTIEQRRTPPAPDDAFIARERDAVEQAFKAVEDARKRRDAAEEQIFAFIYGAAGIGDGGKRITTEGGQP
jgi:hypothetical protein